ncbi:hypothetical protein B0O99DRAFT_604060 [Bisporella sp. PMI_857]|nr:hypothetical protein B0O99DRAFT_604060 [Bisporella sp. PMI_857]
MLIHLVTAELFCVGKWWSCPASTVILLPLSILIVPFSVLAPPLVLFSTARVSTTPFRFIVLQIYTCQMIAKPESTSLSAAYTVSTAQVNNFKSGLPPKDEEALPNV